MATWHGYIAVEDIALTTPQRAAIIAAFRALGPSSDPQPARLNHWRTSLDGSKAIFEAAFNADNLPAEKVRNFLADAVGISPDIIDTALTQTARGPLLTFSAGGTDRMRMLAFGGIGATWEESRQQAVAYLAANIAGWEVQE